MSTITWIIIVLIVISIGVTVSEVGLRFALLEKKGKGRMGGSQMAIAGNLESQSGIGRAPVVNVTGVRQGLSAEEVSALCGTEIVGKTFAELGYC